jgi:hypothetical protein
VGITRHRSLLTKLQPRRMALEAKRSCYVAVAIARATWRVLGAVMGIQSARQVASACPGVVLRAQRGYRFG